MQYVISLHDTHFYSINTKQSSSINCGWVHSARTHMIKTALHVTKKCFCYSMAGAYAHIRALFQYPMTRLIVSSLKVSKAQDRVVQCSSRFKISKQSDITIYKSRGFETLRNLTNRALDFKRVRDSLQWRSRNCGIWFCVRIFWCRIYNNTIHKSIQINYMKPIFSRNGVNSK